MIRKVYIIPSNANVSDHVTNAIAAGCGEIVQGIPSKFINSIGKQKLPFVYEEYIDQTKPPNPEIEELKNMIASLQEEIITLQKKV